MTPLSMQGSHTCLAFYYLFAQVYKHHGRLAPACTSIVLYQRAKRESINVKLRIEKSECDTPSNSSIQICHVATYLVLVFAFFFFF